VEVKLHLWYKLNNNNNNKKLGHLIFMSFRGLGEDKTFNLSSNKKSKAVSAPKMIEL
jgi:hypothetical protein